MTFKMKLLHQGLVLISVPLAFQLFFSLGFNSLLKESMTQLQKETQAKQIIGKAERIMVLFSESTVLICLNLTRKNPDFDARYSEILSEMKKNFGALKSLAQTKEQREQVQSTGKELRLFLVMQQMLLHGQMPGSPNPGLNDETAERFMQWYKNRDHFHLRSPIYMLIQSELKSANQLMDLQKELESELNKFLWFGLGGDFLLLLGLAAYFGNKMERRLQSLMETTKRLSKGVDLDEPLVGTDELARSDVLLHKTATKLIQTQRFRKQLLGVVCHELKAPLNAVQLILTKVTTEEKELPDRSLKP